VPEARRIVEQRRPGRVEALGLTGAMPIIIGMRAVGMSAVMVRVVLVLFHEEFSEQAGRNLPCGCWSTIEPR
jgi:hypothetical protein